MGREAVLEKLRKSSMGLIVCGVLLCLLALFLFWVGLTESGVTVFALIIAALAATLLYFGIRNYKDPTKTSAFKSNPDLLDMADEMSRDIQYQDKFVTFSSKLLCSTRDVTHIAYLDEVYCAYISKQSTNFIPTSKDLVLLTARGNISISVYGQRKAVIDELGSRIVSNCPLCKVGYTPENLQYAQNMQNQWKAYRNNMALHQ